VYKVALPAAGNITLSIKNKSGFEWQGEIVDSIGQMYESLKTDDSSLTSDYTTTQIGLPKGTYYVVVIDDYWYTKGEYLICQTSRQKGRKRLCLYYPFRHGGKQKNES
jgi:hypothetical protein